MKYEVDPPINDETIGWATEFFPLKRPVLYHRIGNSYRKLASFNDEGAMQTFSTLMLRYLGEKP